MNELLLRGCPQAQFFSHKHIKTYLSHPKKGTFRGLPGVALSRGLDIAGHIKNIVSNIVSLPPLNYPPPVLAVLLVVMLVVVLLSCCCHCLCLLCCRVANTAAAATVGMPPPPPPPPPPSVGKEDDACYRNADSSPPTSAQAVCWALESRVSLDRWLRR
jgi:hypothetical protein